MPPFSYLLFVIFVSYLSGLVIVQFIDVKLELVFIIGTISLIAGFLVRRKSIFYLFLCLLFAALGMIAGIKVTTTRKVLDVWRRNGLSYISFKINSIPTTIEDKIMFTGNVLGKDFNIKICAPKNEKIQPGQIITARGNFRKIGKNIYFFLEDFQIIGSHFSIKKYIYQLKRYFSQMIDELYPYEFAGFVKAITIGDRENLKTIRHNVQRAGLAHILAISGLHVGLILFFFHFIFKISGIKKRARSILLILISVLYLILTAGRPPVMRATIMAVVYLYFSLFYREINIFNLIILAAIIILFLDPAAIYQVSFQLSFIAVVGICLVLKLFPSFQPYSIKGKISNYIKVIFSAWIFTSPLIWYYWKRFTVFQFPVNFVLVPVFTLILSMGFCSLFSSLVAFPLAQFFATASYPFLFFFFKIMEFISNKNYACIKLPPVTAKAVIMIYGFLFAGIYFMSVIIKTNTGGVQCSG